MLIRRSDEMPRTARRGFQLGVGSETINRGAVMDLQKNKFGYYIGMRDKEESVYSLCCLKFGVSDLVNTSS